MVPTVATLAKHTVKAAARVAARCRSLNPSGRRGNEPPYGSFRSANENSASPAAIATYWRPSTAKLTAAA
jgi:hypothetical protein